MPSKKELLSMSEKYAKKAEEAYMNYQETGMARYSSVYRKNDDLSDALLIAAKASDDHQELISLKSSLARIAGLDDPETIALEIRALAELLGLIKRME